MHRSSYCGVNCEKCNAYVATTTGNESLKMKVIKEWGALYKRNFEVEDILCYGCKSDTLFMLCSLCDIKPCNEKHNVSNCQDCENCPCERIDRFFEFHRTYDTGNVFD